MKHEIIDITPDNLGRVDIFCKKSKHKERGYQEKLAWVGAQLARGLRMKILMVHEGGKASSRGFIEYMPGEQCWRGIDAPGWLVIHCLWVVGRYKQHGFGSALLDACIEDAKTSGAHGVCVMATTRKGWLPGTSLFMKNGFEQVDTLAPLHVLLARAVSIKATIPRFIPVPVERLNTYKGKVAIFNTCQCPYVDNIIEEIDVTGVPYDVVRLESSEDVHARGAHPYGTCNVVIDGKVVWYNKAGVFKEAVLAMKGRNE